MALEEELIHDPLTLEDLLKQTRRNLDTIAHLAHQRPLPDATFIGAPDLDGLIGKLLLKVGPDTIARRIEERLRMPCRPRDVLAETLFSSEDEPYNDQIVIATSLRYMFLVFSPLKALDVSCSLTQDQARDLLDEFGVLPPLPGQWDVPICNASEAIRCISHIEDEVTAKCEHGSAATSRVEDQVARAWHLADDVLRLSLAFYALHFAAQLPPEFVGRLRDLLPGGAACQVLPLVNEMEEIFQYGESLVGRRKRERDNQREIDNATDDTQRLERRQKIKMLEEQAVEENRRSARSLRNACLRYLGRESPFRDFVDLYRWRSSSDVLSSLQNARRIVQGCLENRIVPRLVVITGCGRDWYGNPIALFTEIENLTSDFPPRRETVEWMYVDSRLRFSPFQWVAMLTAKAHSSEPFIEPVIYPIESLVTMLKASGGGDVDIPAKLPDASIPDVQIPRDHLIKLREELTNCLDEEEVRTFCYDLGVDYDDLPAQGKEGKVRELLKHCERHGRIPEVVQMIRQKYPHISLPSAS